MIKLLLVIALVFVFCGSAFAADADYCEKKYMKYIDKLKKTDKIMDDMKKKYIPYLMKAQELCKEGNMEEANKVMHELREDFFQDALETEEAFYRN